jgi:lipopolysaccharide/colanic/teichoic acid biosynthesis glycosyltransferase
VLRRYHLDELPNLFNILIGDMSFIGPRPEIPEYVDPAGDRWRSILDVRPGLVDTATLVWMNESEQLRRVTNREDYYRCCILPAKITLSLQDIRNKSLGYDLRLLFKAFYTIVFRSPAPPEAAFKKERQETVQAKRKVM